MKKRNLYINLSAGQGNDRLVGFLPAKGIGRDMYFKELKCKL